MNRITALLIALSIALCSPIARAQDQSDSTTQPDFKGSPVAQQAAKRYQLLTQLATQRYNAALDEARRQYIAALKFEQANQIRKHNTDLADQIAAVIQQLQAESADYKNNSRDSSAGHAMSLDLGNGVQMKFVRIPAGQFLMGSPPTEPARGRDEDQHKVTLTHSFFMGVTHVTQAQYAAVIGSNPSHFHGDDLPVEYVNWDHAVAYCQALSQKTGKHCRLPTEAEWEYAAHAGTQGAYAFGNDPSQFADYAWLGPNSGGTTHPVGQKKPNAWGLYDMQGNLWQWCSTWYCDYPPGDLTDPAGPANGNWRMMKGGAWNTDKITDVRIAMRLYRYAPGHYNLNIGFRVVVDIP